jgi:homogentisate phytyltransferase/homogentisate geranylgeranyltransferase
VWSSIDATDERDVNGAKLFQGTTESIFSNVTTAETVEATVNEEEKPPFPVILWRFTRPHTIIGSALAIPALHLLAAPSVEAALSTRNAVAVVYAMIPSLLMNLYITGLNQITDVEIDKVNKPDLPIAAGLLSRRDAIITVVTALVSSLWMGVAHPVYGTQGLNVALWGSGILGTLYSLWPFRLKRFPFLAAFCIVAVRGTIINASFFAHAKAAAFGDASATVLHCLRTDIRCLLSSLFFGIFGIVIALMKDVPDVRGDRMARVRTFSVRIGQKRVFHAMRRLLQGLFFAVGAGMVRLAAQVTTGPALKACRLITAASAVAAGLSVRKQSQDVDPEDSRQVYGFYMHLWKLFYLSYFALPFAR